MSQPAYFAYTGPHWERWGLSLKPQLRANFPLAQQAAIKHILVSDYLDAHVNAAAGYLAKQPGYLYLDILAIAVGLANISLEQAAALTH